MGRKYQSHSTSDMHATELYTFAYCVKYIMSGLTYSTVDLILSSPAKCMVDSFPHGLLHGPCFSHHEGRRKEVCHAPGQPELAYKGEKFSSRDQEL